MRKQVNTERVHVVLRRGDMDKLKILFPKIGASAFIRQVVSNAIDMMEQEAVIETRRIEGITHGDKLQQLIASAIGDDEPNLGKSTGESDADELERIVSVAPGYPYR